MSIVFGRQRASACATAAIAVVLAVVLLSAAALAADMGTSGRYYTDSTGKPLFLLGYYDWSAVPDGYYIDHPSLYSSMITQGGPYKINYIRISLGVNRMAAGGNPPSWNGVATPVPFPYVNVGGVWKAQLTDAGGTIQWDNTFWDGLKAQCALAKTQGMAVHVSIFDGVELRDQGGADYGYNNSYWNPNKQDKTYYPAGYYGDGSGGFYRLADFNAGTNIGKYQKALIDKVCSELAGYDNVMFEIGNELLGSDSNWNTAVYNYIKTKTNKPVSNVGANPTSGYGFSDHVGDTAAAAKSYVASMVGAGGGPPAWIDPDGSNLGHAVLTDENRRAAWYSFVGGAACYGGFSCDFWEYPVNPPPGFQTVKATYFKNLQDFITISGVKFWTMIPQQSLVSNNGVNSCLAKTGTDYLAYILNDSSATIDLSSLSGAAYYKVYDTKTGVFGNLGSVTGGGVRTFTKPAGADDWVIYVTTDPSLDNISNFTAVGTDGQVALSWTNPQGATFAGTMIRYKTSGYPTSQTDGTLLCDRAASPGSSDSFTHTGISGPMYYYAAYAHNAGSTTYWSGVYVSGSPHTPPAGANVVNGGFEGYFRTATGGFAGVVPQGWTPFVHDAGTAPANITIADDTSAKDAGSHSVRVTTAGSKEGGIYTQINTTVGGSYTVTCKAVVGSVYLGIDTFGGTNGGAEVGDYDTSGVHYFGGSGTVTAGPFTAHASTCTIFMDIYNGGANIDTVTATPAASVDITPPMLGTIAPLVTNNATPTITCPVQDSGIGLATDSAEFRYSTDGGSTFSQWISSAALHSKATVGSGHYWYPDFCHPGYTVVSGDHLVYDIWTNNASGPSGSVDMETTTGGNLRDSGITDQNGVSGHPATNISSRAYHQWYHRDFNLSSAAGVTIAAFEAAHDNSTASPSDFYVRNVWIVNGSTLKVDAFEPMYSQQSESSGPGNNGGSNLFLGVDGNPGDTSTPITCSGPNGSTASQTISAATVPLAVGANNRIQFRVLDVSGNLNTGSVATITVDNTAPTVATRNPVSGAAIVTLPSVAVTFSESVTGVAAGDLTVNGSAATSVTGSGAGPYTFTGYAVPADGTVNVALASGTIQDLGGNAFGGNSWTYAKAAGAVTATINQAAGQADPTKNSPINFTVTFSENVSGFATGDVSFTGSTAPGTLVGTVSGGPSTYNVAVSGMTASGTVVASIGAGVCTSTATGTANSASTSTDNSVTYDNVAPTVTVNQASGQADPSAGPTINFTAVFSENVTGFATGDVTFTGSTAPGTLVGTVTGGPSTYNIAVTGMTGPGTIVATIGAGVCTDTAGNNNAASTSTDNTVTVSQSVTIQRGTYGTVKDAYFRLDGNPDTNFGNPMDPMGLRVYADSGYGAKGPRHNLIAFDLSSIPTGSTIISATFGEYYWAGTGTPTITGLKLSRLQPATTWVEGGGDSSATVNPWPTWNERQFGQTAWATAGATGAADIDLATTKSYDLSGVAGFRTVDVTSFVDGWVNGGWVNNGMLMWGGSDATNNGSGYWLESCSENATVANRPYLNVVYTAPPCNGPVITAQPISLVKSSGANASFSVTATGTGLTYQWKKGASSIGGATSSTYGITGVTAGDAASYSCVVTGTCGATTSDVAVLTVLTSDGSIAAAKGLADNAPVQLGNKDLYLKWPGFAYIEEPTFFSGIRLQGNLTAAAGDRICLVGNIKKPAGAEPYIQMTTMTRASAAGTPPVVANNGAIASGLMDGLYVIACGRVKVGSIVGDSYVITDGADETGIKVITQTAPGVTEGQYVWVTGAAGYDGGRVVYKQ